MPNTQTFLQRATGQSSGAGTPIGSKSTASFVERANADEEKKKKLEADFNAEFSPAVEELKTKLEANPQGVDFSKPFTVKGKSGKTTEVTFKMPEIKPASIPVQNTTPVVDAKPKSLKEKAINLFWKGGAAIDNVGNAAGQALGLGGLMGLPDEVKNFEDPTYANITGKDILKEIPGAAGKVASSVGSFILGAVVNPALGIQEEITGNQAGKVKVGPLEFQSPQSALKQKVNEENWDPALAPWSVMVDQLNASSAFVGTFGAIGNKLNAGLNRVFKYETNPVMMRTGSGEVSYVKDGKVVSTKPGQAAGETVKPKPGDISTHTDPGESLMMDHTKIGVAPDGRLVTVTPTDKGGFMMSTLKRRFIGSEATVPKVTDLPDATIDAKATAPTPKPGSLAAEAAAVEASGGAPVRPPHQVAFEKAIAAGDIAGAKAIVEGIPATDPYKAPMTNIMARYDAPGAAAAAESATGPLSASIPAITAVGAKTTSPGLKTIANTAEQLASAGDHEGLVKLEVQLQETTKALPKTGSAVADAGELSTAINKVVAELQTPAPETQAVEASVGTEIARGYNPSIIQPPTETLTAPSVLSTIANGEKIFTRLTDAELAFLRDEVATIPAPPTGEAQIHLDANTGKPLGREVNRQEFAAAHSQAPSVLYKAQSHNSEQLPPEVEKIMQQIQQVESTIRDEAGLSAAEPILADLQSQLARAMYQHSTRPMSALPPEVSGEALAAHRNLKDQLEQAFQDGRDRSYFDNLAAAANENNTLGGGDIDRAEVIKRFISDRFDAAPDEQLRNFDTNMTERYGLVTPYEKADMAGEIRLNLETELDSLIKEELQTNMREEVRFAEAGKRFSVETQGQGSTDEWHAQESTFPEWFKNRGWTKARVLNTIEKYKGAALADLKDIAESNLASGGDYNFGYRGEPDVQYHKLKETINKLHTYEQQQRAIAEAAAIRAADAKSKGLNSASTSSGDVRGYKGPEQLATNILRDLTGKDRVSKQYIEDLTRKPEIRKIERDLVDRVLERFPDGQKVNVVEFGIAMETELLPLDRRLKQDDYSQATDGFNTRYSAVNLHDRDGMKIRYQEALYESPIQTTAGDVHFAQDYSPEPTADQPAPKGYFAHVRSHDLNTGPAGPANGTREIVEIQSDLFQRGRLQKQIATETNGKSIAEYRDFVSKQPDEWFKTTRAAKMAELANLEEMQNKLQPFEDTWHERIIGEEIRAAAQEKIKTLRFPTGETAMQVEGLASQGAGDAPWYDDGGQAVQPGSIAQGQVITREGLDEDFIVTAVMNPEEFMAAPLDKLLEEWNEDEIKQAIKFPGDHPSIVSMIEDLEEDYSLKGEADKESPIYKFYESEVQAYLKRIRPDLKTITDDQGHTWFETKISPKDRVEAVSAFGESRKVVDPVIEAMKASPDKFTTAQKNILLEHAKQGRKTYPFGGLYKTNDGTPFIAVKADAEMVQGFKIKGITDQLERTNLTDAKLEPATFARKDLKVNKLTTAASKQAIAENVVSAPRKLEQVEELLGNKLADTLQVIESTPDALNNVVDLRVEAAKYETAADFIKAQLKPYEITNTKEIKVYRGEGGGIGNTTLVNGKYFADSKEFAAAFGTVSESTIPAGSKIFDLDLLKNNLDQQLVSPDAMVNPAKLTDFLMDNGFEYTKNTNTRGVEYVNLKRPASTGAEVNAIENFDRITKTVGDLVDKYKTADAFANKASKEFGGAIKIYKDYFKIAKSGQAPQRSNDNAETLLQNAYDQKGSLDQVAADLRHFTNERIGDVPGPAIGLQTEDVNRFKRQKKIDDTIKQPGAVDTAGDIKFSDDSVEARYQASKGLQGSTISRWDRIKEYTAQTWLGFMREYPFMPKSAEFAPVRELLRHHQSAKEVMADKAARMIQGVVGDLGPKKLDLLTRKILLEDLARESEAGRDLPLGFSTEGVLADLEKVNRYMKANPEVEAAYGRRTSLIAALQEDLVNYGVLAKEQIKDNYYRHQVIAHAQDPLKIKMTGERLRIVKRGYQKTRGGTTLDINTDYLQAEFEVMAQGMIDIETAKVVKAIEASPHNIKPMIKQTLKDVQEVLKDTINLDPDGELPVSTEDELIVAARMIEEKFADGNPESATGAAKNAIVKGIADQIRKGHDPKDWHDFVPESHQLWQPKEGNVFFRANTVPERIAKMLMVDGVEEVGITKDELKQAMVMGGPNPEFALRNEVAETLNDLVKYKDEWALRKIVKELTSMWKVWILFNPRRAFRYNLQNMMGDLDALIAGNPKVVTKIHTAVTELYDVYYGQKNMSPTMVDFFDRGGLTSNLTTQEIPDINTLKIFKSQMEKQKTNILKKGMGALNLYWDTVKDLTSFRENIFRYAAYLQYLDEVEARPNRSLKNYGASLPREIDALTDPKDKAAKLARELLGDYASISATGKNMRETLIPFYSWLEVNFTRYNRLVKNAFYTSGDMELVQDSKSGVYRSKTRYERAKTGAAGGARVLAGAGVKLGFNLAKWLMRVSAMWVAFQLWNNLMHGDEEKELSQYDQSRMHLNLGHDKDGQVRVLRVQSSLGDYLQWFGLNDFPTEVRQLNDGQLDMATIIKNRLKAPVNKVVGGVTPAIKTPVEFLAKRSFFPDIFNPRIVRDPYENLAGTFSLNTEYRMLKGKPIRGYGSSWQDTLFTSYDPDSVAYDEIQSLKHEFLSKELGREGDSSYSSPRSEAFRDYKTSLRFGDTKGAQTALQHLVKLGIDMKDLEASVNAADPLNGLSTGKTDPTKNDRTKFILWMNAEQRTKLPAAYKYYLETYKGQKFPADQKLKLDMSGQENK